MTPNPIYAARPAVVAFELLALPSPVAKQGLALRVLMDAAAARLMICGMTSASTGLSYTNGEVAQWMATILSTYYHGDGADLEWADATIASDKDAYGSAYATRGSLATWEDTAAAMREAASALILRAGGYCLVEYGYCDAKGKGPALPAWTDQHADKVIGRVAASESMATAYLIFTDQRAALKSARADNASAASHAAPTTPAGLIAAAIALESEND